MNHNEITEEEILHRAQEVFSALEGRTTPEEMQLNNECGIPSS